MALVHVAIGGETVFRDPVQRGSLAGCLQKGFSAAQFDFWAKIETEAKAVLEGAALLSALEGLVASQFERVAASGHIVSQGDLLGHFRDLWRCELFEQSGKRDGQTTGPLGPDNPTEEEGDDQDALVDQAPDSASDFTEEVIERVSREQDEGHSSSLEDDEAPLGPWKSFFGSLRESLRGAGLDPDSAALRSFLADWEAKRSYWVESRRMYPWDSTLARVEALTLQVLNPALVQKFTDAERHALLSAVRAVLVSAARVKARRGDSLSDQLSQTEMRNLRRAYRRCDGLQERLKELSDVCARVRASSRSEGREDRDTAPEKLKRPRVGRAFLDLAQEADELNLPRVVAGLMAADKVARGLPVTEEELALRDEHARKWVKGDRRREILRRLPDTRVLAAAVCQDGSHRAAEWFSQHCLRLALLCWPEGAPQLLSPASPGT